MVRKPKASDAGPQAPTERAKEPKGQKTVRLGEPVQVTGADGLPVEALAGVLLAAVEQSKERPGAVARWTERGQDLFQAGGKRGRKSEAGNGAGAAGSDGTGESAVGTAGHGAAAPAPGGGTA